MPQPDQPREAGSPENGPWRLWHRRPGKKSKWRPIGAYATREAAWDAMAGDWLVRDGARDPNGDRKPWQ